MLGTLIRCSHYISFFGNPPTSTLRNNDFQNGLSKRKYILFAMFCAVEGRKEVRKGPVVRKGWALGSHCLGLNHSSTYSKLSGLSKWLIYQRLGVHLYKMGMVIMPTYLMALASPQECPLMTPTSWYLQLGIVLPIVSGLVCVTNRKWQKGYVTFKVQWC